MMYLGFQEDRIVSYTEQPLDKNLYNLDRVEETQDVYVYDNDVEQYVLLDDDYKTKQEMKEKERVANLTMTSLDFITFLETLGLTLEEITAWLELPENLRVKTQLTYCQNVYCRVVVPLLPIEITAATGTVTITEDKVINAFKAKYGEV